MKEQEVYVKVSVEDELPEKEDVYLALKPISGKPEATVFLPEEQKFGDLSVNGNFYPVHPKYFSHWLKPTTGILLTKEELVEMLKESFSEGESWMIAANNGAEENTESECFDEFLKEKGLL